MKEECKVGCCVLIHCERSAGRWTGKKLFQVQHPIRRAVDERGER